MRNHTCRCAGPHWRNRTRVCVSHARQSAQGTNTRFADASRELVCARVRLRSPAAFKHSLHSQTCPSNNFAQGTRTAALGCIASKPVEDRHQQAPYGQGLTMRHLLSLAHVQGLCIGLRTSDTFYPDSCMSQILSVRRALISTLFWYICKHVIAVWQWTLVTWVGSAQPLQAANIASNATRIPHANGANGTTKVLHADSCC